MKAVFKGKTAGRIVTWETYQVIVENAYRNGKNVLTITPFGGEPFVYGSIQILSRDWKLIAEDPDEVDTIAHTDEKLRELWSIFGDIPMDPDTEKLEEQFLHFPAGTHRERIWKWFDERYSAGVASLLIGDGVDRAPVIASLYYRNSLCFDCESVSCGYNHEGECRYSLIHEKKPRITEDDGCIDSVVDVFAL